MSWKLFSFASNCELKPFWLSDHDIVWMTCVPDNLGYENLMTLLDDTFFSDKFGAHERFD